MPDIWDFAPIMYRRMVAQGLNPRDAFRETCEAIDEVIAARKEAELAWKWHG